MIFNLFVISITIFLGLLFSDPKIIKWSDEIKRKRYIWIISIILILQSGLRNVAVGADTFAYYQSFEQIKLMNWSSVFQSFSDYYILGTGKDPGYTVLQKGIQIVIGDYQIFLLLIAILFFAGLGNFVYKNTTRLWEAVFAFTLYSALFYGFFSITGHRQTIATAATLYSFELIKKRRLLLFIAIILLASTIHRSCLIFLPFYLLYNVKLTRILYPLALITFPVIMVFREPVADKLKDLAGYQQYGIYAGAGTYTFTAMLLLIALLAWWRLKYVLNNNEEYRPLYNAFILAIILTPLTWVNPSAMRVVQYFSVFLMVLIPSVLDSFTGIRFNLRRGAYAAAIIGLLLLSVKSGWDMEYRFFWQQMDLGPNYTQWINLQ